MKAILTIAALLFLGNIKSHAQLYPVYREGKRVSCEEICNGASDDYSSENRVCLNCKFYFADSTMNAEYKAALLRLKNGNSKTKLQKNQRAWLQQIEKKAKKESDLYKGGTMEMKEYVRMKLLETEKRTIYLKKYKE